jgi:hypothetical protein
MSGLSVPDVVAATERSEPVRLEYETHPALPQSQRRWSLHRWTVVVGLASALSTVLVSVVGAVALSQLNRARRELYRRLDPALLEAQQATLSLVNPGNRLRRDR